MKEIISSETPNNNVVPSESDVKVTTVKGINGRDIKLFVPATKKGVKIIAEMDEAGVIDTAISFGDAKNKAK